MPRPDHSWVLPSVAAACALALVAVTVTAASIIWSQRQQIEALTQEVAELEAAQSPSSGPSMGDLFGEDGLEDLLEGFLGELFENLAPEDLEGLGEAFGSLACLQEAVLAPTDPVPAAPVEEQLQLITELVEELRGLQFAVAPPTQFLPSRDFEAELLRRVEEDLSDEELELDHRLLVALGAIDEAFDLREAQLELVSGQAAGFYDTREQVIVVRVDDPSEPLTLTEQVVLAHELEHALSDEHSGIPDTTELDGDAALAALAVTEGSATVLMQQYALSALSTSDQLGLSLDPELLDAQRQLDDFPHVLSRQLLFPYEEGFEFVCALHGADGWSAVDASIANPPQTTADILDPGGGRAPPADPPERSLPDGWERVRDDTLGVAALQWLFEAPGDDPNVALSEPRERALAWTAGTYTLWTRGDDTAVALDLRGRGGAGHDLCESVTDWYDAAHPDSTVSRSQEPGTEVVEFSSARQHAAVSCSDEDVTVGIGPDEQATSLIVD